MPRTSKLIPAVAVWTLLGFFAILPPAGAADKDGAADKASVPPPPMAGGAGMQSPYQVGAGDLLLIVVWKNPELTGEHLVRPDGRITLPLVGDIIASGMTTDTIAFQVERKLENFIETPFVNVIVREPRSSTVFVLGEVARPGAYPLSGSLTVLQAVSLAGGFTAFAKKDDLVLVRNEGSAQKRFRLSFSEILKAPREENNPSLKKGDTLVVP